VDALALTRSGEIYGWGTNELGALGRTIQDGALSRVPVPLSVNSILGHHVIAVSADVDEVLALLDNGEVYAWGAGDTGQLGNGFCDGDPHPVPVPVRRL
jgi:alpha-tubulin suppressor-like RCC1 family protein